MGGVFCVVAFGVVRDVPGGFRAGFSGALGVTVPIAIGVCVPGARVCGFVLLYYGLWATADAIILFAGSDLGFGLRVVPNLLYYGGLIAAMAWFAPRVADAQARA